jgi:NADH dehydrogenase [ubiquinone] 1 alpha subcomplex assembly factor 7
MPIRWLSSQNTLSRFLAQTIKASGPISLATYMRQCLTNPSEGYYINKDPFGRAGDFVTSPEISQMFGELVGIWILAQWIAQGKPDRFRLVEFGPGRGTLMDDLLRAGRSFKQFDQSIKEIYMIEASPTLRHLQRNLLCGEGEVLTPADTGYRATTRWGTPIFWFETAKEIPRDKIATFVIAHEFFDALPVLQFEHTDNGWRERMVDCNDDSNTPSFHMTVNPHWTPTSKVVPQSHERYSKLPVGSKVEICPEAWDVADQIAEVIETSRGAALIVDYGPADTIPIDSLRAIKEHKIISPFLDPGEADLSTDVDFQALKVAATQNHQIDVHGPLDQGDWLHTMGIGSRATVLASNQRTDEGKKRIEQAYNRLVEKGGGAMGKVYKVMSFVPKGTPVPVGFGGDVHVD